MPIHMPSVMPDSANRMATTKKRFDNVMEASPESDLRSMIRFNGNGYAPDFTASAMSDGNPARVGIAIGACLRKASMA
jgi:hypothetical protein